MKVDNTMIEEVVSDVIGADALPLVQTLKNKKNVSEFKIAESTKQQINETRNILYRLHNANLVSFIRKKDKKKGWYIYYWTFNPKRITDLRTGIKKQRMERLMERLEREQHNDFFLCDNKCIRLNFDQSTDFNYKCPECGQLMQQENNREKISSLKKDIAKLTKELNHKNNRPSTGRKKREGVV